MPITNPDTPESAKAMVQEWAAGSYRMNRMGGLIEIVRKCKNEEQLRWVAEALAIALRPHGRPAGRTMPGTKAPTPAPGALNAPDEIIESSFVELEVEEDEARPPAAPLAIPAQAKPPGKLVESRPPSRISPPTAQAQAPAPKAAAPAPPVDLSLPTPSKDDTKMRRAHTRSIPPPLAPSPETMPRIDPATLPPGVDPDILADVLRVEQCRRIFESSNQQIETWEVFCLVMMEGDITRIELERVLALRAAGDTLGFTEGATEMFQKVLELRKKFGTFAQQVRDYVSTLQVGRFGKDTIETALGFLIVSGRGREAASRWLTEPKRNEPEASGRWEGLIATAMRYQTAAMHLRQAKK